MKFANIIYKKRNERINLGDDMQLLAVENLYSYMGIAKDDIVRIDFSELATYDGEYVVLPIAFPLCAYSHKQFITNYSERIIPVFLSVCILSDTLCMEDIDYLKRYAPIGCRDEYTLKNLRKYGIPSYLNGCITLTFPKRNTKVKGNKIFCIDITEKIKKIIPAEISKDCIYISQTYYMSELDCQPEEKARQIYEQYKEEAKMVITTRMHAALPCIAAGIPTIFLKDKFSYRFLGIDNLVKIYCEEEYNTIDWNPLPIDLEKHKRQVLAIAQEKLINAYNQYQAIYVLSERIEHQHLPQYHIEYIDNVKEYLTKSWSKNEKIEYVLWGVTQTAVIINKFIREQFPNAILKGVIDRCKRMEFCGVNTETKEKVQCDQNTFFLICTSSAIKEAHQFFKYNNIRKYYQCCDDNIIHYLDK